MAALLFALLSAPPVVCEGAVAAAASEPLVADPVAARFDPRGRLWVVEMPDYPTGPADGAPPAGRVRVLSDADRDGVFEAARTFAEGLLMPTGVQPWRDGAVLTLAGKVAVLRDADGDGRADAEEVLLTGLAEGNEQLRANHPTIGPDGWLHVANGLRTVEVTDARDGSKTAVRGTDFRLRLDRPGIEPVTGHGQHGMTFDRRGHRFVCSNARPLDYGVIPQRDLNRNPHLPDTRSVDAVIPGGQSRPVFPLVAQATTALDHAGSFTAACGVLADWDGHVFVCEPTGSLIHRERLTRAGGTFTAEPTEAGRSWLASRDPWFRPVDLTTAPGGSLIVCDMRRKVIEHPHWMPEEARAASDFAAGRGEGRVWRVATASHEWRPFEDGDDLVARLAGAETAWEADSARRLILEAGVESQAEALSAYRGTPEGQLRCRQLLAGAGLLRLKEASAGVASEDAAEVAGTLRLLTGEQAESLRPWIGRRAEHEDAAVRFEAALRLGDLQEPEPGALMDVVRRDFDDPWSRQAVLTSCAGRRSPPVSKGVGLFGFLFAWPLWALPDRPTALLLLRVVMADAAAYEPESIAELASAASAACREKEAVETALALFEHAADEAGEERTLACLLGLLRPEVAAALRTDFAPVTASLRLWTAGVAGRPDLPDGVRADAVRLRGLLESDGDWIGELEQDSADATAVAVASVFRQRDDWPVPNEVFDGFAERPATVREAFMDAMLLTQQRRDTLLDAVAAGRVPATLIDPLRAERLRSLPDTAGRAAELLPPLDDLPEDVWAEYAAALDPKGGDLEAGRAVFAKHCAVCHRVGAEGGNAGPDLSDLRTKSRTQLLEAILKPNAAIDAAYVAHTVLTADGRVLSGVVAGESTAALTLRGTDGRQTTVPRDDIESLVSTGKSLMPERLDRLVPPAEMSDLIHFLKAWRYAAP